MEARLVARDKITGKIVGSVDLPGGGIGATIKSTLHSPSVATFPS